MGIDLHKETHTAVVLDCWRKSVSMYQKSDSYDAEAVALALINMLDRLPDAVPDDKYRTLGRHHQRDCPRSAALSKIKR